MAGAIKGITIEFRGNTTPLDRALQKINKETRSVDQDLRAVNRALKFNPTNTELLRQKFTLLSQKIDKTEDELKQLRQAEATLKANNVSKQSQEWMTVRRKIIEAESKLKTFKAQLASVRYASLAALGKAFQNAGQKMRTAGMYATIGGGAMVLAGKKLLELNRTQESAERKLVEVYKSRMGVNKKAAKSTMDLASALQKQGVVGDEVILSGAQMLATYAKTPGTVNKLLPSMTNLLVQMKGYDATADDATNVAKMFGKVMTGQTGALTRAGITFTDAQEKVLKYGTEEEKAAMLAEVVTQNVGNMNSVFAQTDEGKMVQLKNNLSDIGESLGQILLPALGAAAGWLSEKFVPQVERLVGFLEAHPVIVKIAVGITGLLVVGGPLLILIGGVITAVGTILGSIGSLISFLGMLISPIGLVVAAIAGAIAIGVLLYKNWDTIKAKILAVWNSILAYARAKWAAIKSAVLTPIQNAKNSAVSLFQSLKSGIASKVDSIKEKITSTFNSIKDKIISPITKAKDKISEIVEKIKGFFPITIGKIFSGIQLPKFSLFGKFSAKKGTVPQVKMDWKAAHAEGGIFNRPTLLTSTGGVNHLVGEGSSAEAILPLDTLWSHMAQMADSIVNGVAMAGAMQAAGAGAAPIEINLYAFPGGPQLQKFVVDTYDTGKQRLG